MKALVLLLGVLRSMEAQVPADPTCPLHCEYGAPCVKGQLDTKGLPVDEKGDPLLHPALDMNGWVCDCPHGYTGIRCERIFSSCNEDESQGC